MPPLSTSSNESIRVAVVIAPPSSLSCERGCRHDDDDDDDDDVIDGECDIVVPYPMMPPSPLIFEGGGFRFR